MPTVKAAGYHGVQNVKVAARNAEGTYAAPLSLMYAENISITASNNTTQKYADNRRTLNIMTDNGYTGEIGCSAQDVDFELAAGYLVNTTSGPAEVRLTGLKRYAIYYEFIEQTEASGPRVVKVWMLNCDLGKGIANGHATDTDSKQFGQVVHAYTTYGEPLTDDGDAPVYDANGNQIMVWRMISRPGDAGYTAFGAAVPAVVKTEG